MTAPERSVSQSWTFQPGGYRAMPVIDNNSVHEIASWRREGHGIWYFVFVVGGYDEDFVMREPGKLSEKFA